MTRTLIEVPLSRLLSGKRNPRRVRPSPEADRRLVALIRSQGLLQPLVVAPALGKRGHYLVIAGERRLKALRAIHRDANPMIACMLRDVDGNTAASLALGENFGREPMHPLDEAEAFARLAAQDGKDAEAIAAEFGTSTRYVRQRMKLAELASDIKSAYRAAEIDTASAEAFASVPPVRQSEVWKELGGRVQHAQQIRNLIAHAWVDATHAVFDVSTLSESAVSQDLFGGQVLIERQAFFAAQQEALEAERARLIDDGWKEVVVGQYGDCRDRLMAMTTPEREYDEETAVKLAKLNERWRKLEAKADALSGEDEQSRAKLEEKFEALEAEQREIEEVAQVVYSEATKAIATMFLLCLPDGQVQREVRVPRASRKGGEDNTSSDGRGARGDSGQANTPVPTSDDLSDRQVAAAFAHQAIAVRSALLDHPVVLRRVAALMLSQAVRGSDALALRRDANGVSLAAEQEGFSSTAFDRIRALRAELDPLAGDDFVQDVDAYAKLSKIKDKKLDALIELLVTECLTASLARPTPLICILAEELRVDLRRSWTPDGHWLSGYTKAQLAHLLVELKGPVHAPAPERKKSDLVVQLAMLFEQAREGTLDDNVLAQRVNAWLPANLRPSTDCSRTPNRGSSTVRSA